MQTINNAINIKDLYFKYDQDFVLKNINLEVKEKDFLTILGPNGGGKSTLIKLILGIEKLQGGSIHIFNKELFKETQNIAYVPQNTNVNTHFPIKVLEVVMMAQNSMKKRFFFYSKEEKTEALNALKKVNMQAYCNKKMGELSGGQKQKVLIARALFGNAKIILLDEPTSSLDILACEQIYKILKKLNETITIIVISHDLALVLKYANKAVYINKELTFHDLGKMKDEFVNLNSNTCEIELLQMLGRCKC